MWVLYPGLEEIRGGLLQHQGGESGEAMVLKNPTGRQGVDERLRRFHISR